ncbi:MAG: hypothetical protein ACTHK6_01165 [Solirubrobacterales bacterium]
MENTLKSYAFIAPVALGMGFALVGPLLWHLRKELVFGWREQFGTDSDDNDDLVKERADMLRSMEPFSWRIIVLLTAILIVMCVVFGVVVAHGGVVFSISGVIVISALIVSFNVILLDQFPQLPKGGGGAARNSSAR